MIFLNFVFLEFLNFLKKSILLKKKKIRIINKSTNFVIQLNFLKLLKKS